MALCGWCGWWWGFGKSTAAAYCLRLPYSWILLVKHGPWTRKYTICWCGNRILLQPLISIIRGFESPSSSRMLWVGFCQSRPSINLGYYVFNTSRHEALTLRKEINAIILEQSKIGQKHYKVCSALSTQVNHCRTRNSGMLVPGSSIFMAFVIGLYKQQPGDQVSKAGVSDTGIREAHYRRPEIISDPFLSPELITSKNQS